MVPSGFVNIAHRGASAYAPENTFSAFDKALSLGVDQVELDVHFSEDGHIVVIHDDNLDRTTNGSGPVSAHSLAQLRSLDAGSWFGPEYGGERIPSLGEVLERYKGRLYLHIEIKAQVEGLTQRTVDLVRGYGLVGKSRSLFLPKIRAPKLKLADFSESRVETDVSVGPSRHLLKISLSASPSSGWSNSNPLFNNFVGSTRALASSVSAISPKISRRMNRGMGNMVGREIARPSDFVNSVFVTGLGVATIVGPTRASFSSIWRMALVMSWRVIQGM